MIPRAADIETQLREHYGDGAVYYTRQVTRDLAAHFKLTPQELAESDGSHPRFAHKVHSALARHHSLGLLVRLKRGSFRYRPEKLAEYEPHHHPPRVHKTGNSHQQETVAEAIRRREGSMIEFTRIISNPEVNYYYLNLTDEYGKRHGDEFPVEAT